MFIKRGGVRMVVTRREEGTYLTFGVTELVAQFSKPLPRITVTVNRFFGVLRDYLGSAKVEF